MKIILSPAKRMNRSVSTSLLQPTEPVFIHKALMLVELLRQMSPGEIQKALGITGNMLSQTRELYALFGSGRNTAVQTICGFNGTAFAALDYGSFSNEDLLFAQEHLRIFSGLYGILRPSDMIEPYRLDLANRLKTETGNLYEFWKEDINLFLKNEAENELIFNLASDEYGKLLDQYEFSKSILALSFKEFRNGKYQAVSPAVKKARGLMARYIIRNKITTREGIKEFKEDNYLYSPDHSSESEWVFVR
ncbi:MAG: YaaA family protein [Bacteroidales bacterium]